MANNWEYDQRQRDKAWAIASVMVLATIGLLAAGVIAAIVLMSIYLP